MIITIVPEYTKNIGDCCRVKKRNDEILYEKRIELVLKEIFKGNFVDFGAIKQRIAKILKQRSLTPIYISSEEILIPIRVRRPLSKKDSSFGYVNVFQIKMITNNEIILHNGQRVGFLDTKRTIQKRINMAEVLEKEFSLVFKRNSQTVNQSDTEELLRNYLLKLMYQVIQKETVANL